MRWTFADLERRPSVEYLDDDDPSLGVVVKNADGQPTAFMSAADYVALRRAGGWTRTKSLHCMAR